ncbi:hypothetical protein MSAN_00678600 [Mycena sanguinolenta]|uniref:Uncharacterized protein n=1 Tax=Mycena sanguinolenta TaxID=230812 RepID=A0A8H7DFN1_9AGAR|nr:hypothetical protein MSAN_00678600 [Mycena sanguinolenta]
MIPTAVARSRFKGRRPLQSFMANKDYYKGNRQASLPGHRTGAPGVHINRRPGYQLLESKVRVFVAPPISDIIASPLKPYVADGVPVPWKERHGIFAGMPSAGLTAEHFLKMARKYSAEKVAGAGAKTTKADDTKIETVDVVDAAPTPAPTPSA